MYNDIIEQLKEQLREQDFSNIKDKSFHLGVFSEPYLTYMLTGQKTIESRFSKYRILPYAKITDKDIVIIKKNSGPVIGYFTIKKVLFFNLNDVSISTLKTKYNKSLCLAESFWKSKAKSNYVSLLFIDKVVKLQPFLITKRSQQTWLKLS